MSGISASRHHADWLSLVEVSGPFMSLPVLLKAFPQGLDPRNPDQAKALRSAYEEWQENPTAPGHHRAWVLHVLTALLGFPIDLLTETQTLPAGLEANMAELGETLRPDFAVVGPPGSPAAGQAQMLIVSYYPWQELDRPVLGKHWKANPATRMAELLHTSGVPIGLVTNGEQWMLVFSPRGETSGFASWYSPLWFDEPITLRAFQSLLGVRRFFGVTADNNLLGLLKDSAHDQEEVTDQLGYQVREAVEVLVQAFDTLDQDSKRALLKDVSETTLYEAALTVMMRLVFLFSAEERGLLHLGKPLYDDNYAVSTLMDQLQETADLYGPQVLERRVDAWARLIASFRAVHGGVQHQDLLMPAYGGSLFDPDRFPFLESRALGTSWRTTLAAPIAVNNRVALHLLSSLQRLRIRLPGGGPAETRRISFRALGVEQIGHVYEGLLDHTAVRASETVLGLRGTRDKQAEVPLTKLEAILAQGQDKLFEFLKEETGRSASAIKRAMDDVESPFDDHKLLIACGHDAALVLRVRPFAALIREDSFERPMIVLSGSMYVTDGTTRRSTGTHYTPPSLTEPIVQYTLEPLVYEGPSQGSPREQWLLNPPKAILDLKICDMAMGSGAFLVQACRYLAERLVEAWENEEKKHPDEILATPEGGFSRGLPSERLVPRDSVERLAIARRFVADRCLYGVDINPMAVEMAKLSLWLITLDAKRPFTFLDHAFKCGDSLLGLSSFKQLEDFSLRPEGGRQFAFSTMNLWRHIEEAKKKREVLEALSSDTPEQIAEKVALYDEAEVAVAKLKAAADVLVAVELRGLNEKQYDEAREVAADHVMANWAKGVSELEAYSKTQLDGRRALHWPLAFPEISERGGFDGYVGNPPFMGGRLIGRALGADYQHVLDEIRNHVAGSPDLCAYFLLRAFALMANNGCMGMIATKSVAETGSRVVSLDQIVGSGGVIHRAESRRAWPGFASVVVAIVHITKQPWRGLRILDGRSVSAINTGLEEATSDVASIAFTLRAFSGKFSQGQDIMGKGFELSESERADLIGEDPSSSDVIFPLFNGQDLNNMPVLKPYRWVIYFRNWPEEEARQYKVAFERVRRLVKPYRDALTGQIHQTCFWKFWDLRPRLMDELSKHDFILVAAINTKYVCFRRVPSTNVYNKKAKLIYVYTDWEFGVLQSTFHSEWAEWRCGTLGAATLNYSTSAALETWAMPRPSEECKKCLDEIAQKYHSDREELLTSRQVGLTDCYNLFHSEAEMSEDVSSLRRLHVRMDEAVASAYGWTDLDFDYRFRDSKMGKRYAMSETDRRKVLDRLLAMNHDCHTEEETEQFKSQANSKSAPKRSRRAKSAGVPTLPDLFE